VILKKKEVTMKKSVLVVWVLLCFSICTSFAVEVTLLGPKQYLRTKQSPTKYSDTFPGRIGQGTLYIKNGTVGGQNRIDSAIIKVNGTTVFGTASFDLSVYNLQAPISLLENNTISIELRSAPGSYFTIEIKEVIDAAAAAVIGASGGSLANTDGTVVLEIPPHSVLNDTVISLSISESIQSNAILEAVNYTPVSRNVILEPTGLEYFPQ
jgi:hypothetical protein